MVLPYIDMNPPRVYMCSPSWAPLPLPSPSHSSGSSQCTSPEPPVSCIEPGLAIHFTYDNIHVSMLFSRIWHGEANRKKMKILWEKLHLKMPFKLKKLKVFWISQPQKRPYVHCQLHFVKEKSFLIFQFLKILWNVMTRNESTLTDAVGSQQILTERLNGRINEKVDRW